MSDPHTPTSAELQREDAGPRAEAAPGDTAAASTAVRVLSWFGRNLIALTLLGVAVYGVLEATNWRFQVRLAPQFAAGVVAVLAILALVRDTSQGRGDAASPTDLRAAARGFVERQTGFLWFAAAMLVVLLLGMQLGLLVAIALICKAALDARWTTTVVLVLAATGVLLLFDRFFRIFWFEGWLFRLLPG